MKKLIITVIVGAVLFCSTLNAKGDNVETISNKSEDMNTSVEDIFSLTESTLKQNRYIAIKRDNIIEQFDCLERTFTSLNVDTGDITSEETSYNNYIDYRIATLRELYGELILDVYTDTKTIPNETFYRLSIKYNSDTNELTEDYFIDATNNVIVGVMYLDNTKSDKDCIVYKTWYSDNPFIVNEEE